MGAHADGTLQELSVEIHQFSEMRGSKSMQAYLGTKIALNVLFLQQQFSLHDTLNVGKIPNVALHRSVNKMCSKSVRGASSAFANIRQAS